MEVQILSQKFVKPSTPTPNHHINHKLSFIDHLAPSASVPLIFYYSADVNAFACVKRLERLEESLSETLTLYYPFAGRFVKDKLLVECNDQGVEYIEARVSGFNLDEIIEGKVVVEQLDCLVPYIGEVDAYTTPLVLIQVNIFDCGGLAIATRISHKLGDAVTGLAFINAWATTSREGVGEVVPPNFDLASAIPMRSLSTHLTPPVPQKERTLKLVTKRLVFDENAISALKEKAIQLFEDDHFGVKFSPTRVEVVSAVIWRALINTARLKNGYVKPSVIVHSLNLRGKTDPPVSQNTCGNFYVLSPAKFTPDNSKMELHHLVILIKDAMSKTNKIYCNAVLSGNEFFRLVLDSFEDVTKESLKAKEIDVCMFTSWCRAPLYGADFGFGKPSWVSGARRGREMVSLQDTKCGQGVEVWVTLNEHDMVHFNKDLDISFSC